LAGWISQQQRDVISYLQAENRVLREQLRPRRLHFTDDQRICLAAKAKLLRRRVLQVAARDRAGGVDLRLVPLKSWDLLSKAENILRNEPDWPWLPLQRHGQGIQSLSVNFLFQAFVDHLLAELYEPESVPVLALEEPETHLHSQPARTSWAHVSALPFKKSS
jgi:predicted ATP-dependent endonuclease of OLD family